MTRLLRSGAVLAHSEHLHILRRLHTEQVTSADPDNQKSAAHQTVFAVRQGLLETETDDLRRQYRTMEESHVAEYEQDSGLISRMLPDRIVEHRPVLVELDPDHDVELPSSAILGEYHESSSARRLVMLDHASLPELSSLASGGVRWQLVDEHEDPVQRLKRLAQESGMSVVALSTGIPLPGMDVRATWTSGGAEGSRIVMGVPDESGFDFLSHEYKNLKPGSAQHSLLVIANGPEGEQALMEFLEGGQG